MSYGENLAITLAAPSYIVGGNWGFLSFYNPNYEELANYLLEEGIDRMEVENGYIVFVDKEKMRSEIKEIAPEYINPKIDEKHNDRFIVQKQKTIEILKLIAKNDTEYGFETSDGKIFNVLLYSNEEKEYTKQNGIKYPALSLKLIEFLKILLALKKYKEVQVLCEIDENGSFGYKDFNKELVVNEMDSIQKALEIADTNMGAFISIKVL